jgi:Tol biopolymer transport system component
MKTMKASTLISWPIAALGLVAMSLGACSGSEPAARPGASSPPGAVSSPTATTSAAPSAGPSSSTRRGRKSVQANKESNQPALSADGRFVAFVSMATNLVPHDTNRASDIFLRDTKTGVTTRISVASSGTQGNEDSYSPSISADGRTIAFISWASNLVAGDTNHCLAVAAAYEGCADVFVHDRVTGATSRVSISSSGAQSNQRSETVQISADGRHVAFSSWASNIVPGDTNDCSEGTGADQPPGCPDVFVRDLDSHRTERVSVASDGSQLPGGGGLPSISADGSVVGFLTLDEQRTRDFIRVRDRKAGTTTAVSDPPGIATTDGPVSAVVTGDGAHIFFVQSDRIFRHDRASASSKYVGPWSTPGTAPQGTLGARISLTPDGRFVAFSSDGELSGGDRDGQADIYLLEVATGRVALMSTSSNGVNPKKWCFDPVISADGRSVAFYTDSPDLVPGDTNRVSDVFVHDRTDGSTTRESVS